MVWPIPGYSINQAYGIRGQYWRACGWHTGTDIAAPKGTSIKAPIAGTIRWRNYGSSFGRSQFVISPSKGQPFANEEFFVAHTLDRLPNGTEVKAGQHIARVGADGNATGPHGHFERHGRKQAWNCGVMLNPQDMFNWKPTGAPSPSPSPSPQPEEDEVVVILIQHKGTRYACYPAAGTKRKIHSPKEESAIKSITQKVGGRIVEWSAGKDVDDLEAFGVTL